MTDRRTGSLLDESAEDLYENAPCGYLTTLPDGTVDRTELTVPANTGGGA